MRSTHFRRAKRKRRRVQMAGALHAAVLSINATAIHALARESNRLAEADRTASHGPRVSAKETAKKTRENPEENRRVSRGWRNNQIKVKALQKGLSRLESEQTYSTETPYTGSPRCDDNRSFSEWDDGWSSVGWHEGSDQTYDNSASSLSHGSLDLGAVSSPKRVDWRE